MEDLVESILDYVRSDYTDYAIMINGEWGSGKTSFMNMIKEKLPKDNFNEDNLIFVNVSQKASVTVRKTIHRIVLLTASNPLLAKVQKNRTVQEVLSCFLARRKGFEPPTFWFVAQHSIQLS